jgi:hypothetical protein
MQCLAGEWEEEAKLEFTISTAHVECTVNQLINWRMCKKQQMGWPGRSPRNLLYVKNRDH